MYETGFKNDTNHEDSVNATFRINGQVMKRLRKEAERKQISLNAYINQVLYQYVDWDLFESRIGMMPFPKSVLTTIFANLGADEITKLATGIGKNTAIEMAIFARGKFNADAFVSWIETRMKNSGCEVVDRTTEDGAQNIIIKHDLGKNWSLYMKTLIESALKEAFGIAPNTFVSDSLVSITCKM
jgi:hypothetical protein